MKILLLQLLKFILFVAVIVVSFKVNTLFGWGVTAVLIVYLIYRSRSRFLGTRANVEFSKGNTEGAIHYLEKATSLKHCAPDYFLSLSFLLLKTGNAARSEQISRKLLENIEKRDIRMQATMNLALAEWMQGREDEGYERMKEVFDKYKNTLSYGSLGYMMILRGELEEALVFNVEAHQYNSDNNTIVDNLAQTYFMLGQYGKAAEFYEQLFTKPQSYAESSYYYGLTLDHLGKTGQAIEWMEKAAEMEISFMSRIGKEQIQLELERLRAEQGEGEPSP